MKRKALFTWLNEERYDIIVLQETYSTVVVEDIWRTQWRGKLFFAYGFNHSRGVKLCREILYKIKKTEINRRKKKEMTKNKFKKIIILNNAQFASMHLNLLVISYIFLEVLKKTDYFSHS